MFKKSLTLKIGLLLAVLAVTLFLIGLFLAGEAQKTAPVPTDACIGCGIIMLFATIIGVLSLILISLGIVIGRKPDNKN